MTASWNWLGNVTLIYLPPAPRCRGRKPSELFDTSRSHHYDSDPLNVLSGSTRTGGFHGREEEGRKEEEEDREAKDCQEDAQEEITLPLA